jgi:hypothetical protein
MRERERGEHVVWRWWIFVGRGATHVAHTLRGRRENWGDLAVHLLVGFQRRSE